MTRSRRFLGGLRFAYLYQGLAMVSGLVLTPFLLRHLGQHDYGLWLVGLQTLSYLMLMDFGIVALLPRSTAYATGHALSGAAGGDLSDLIGRTARVVLYQTPLVGAGVAAVWLLVPMAPGVRGPILIALAGFVLLFPLRIFQAVLQGLQEMPYLGKLQFVSWAISTSLIVILIYCGVGLYALAVGWVTGQLVPAALSYRRLKRAFPGTLPSGLPKMGTRELFQSLMSGGWVSITQVGQLLIAGTDLLIIGKFLGAAAVVPYACTQKLLMVLANQPHMIMELAAPGLSQMKTSESKDRIFRVCASLTVGLLTASGAVVCVVLAINHSFVSWWLGEQQFGGNLLTVAFCAAIMLRHWNNTTLYTIFALGYERRISLTTLGDGMVAVSTGLLLVHRLGPIGAPIGTMLGLCLVSLPGNLSALAGELQVSIFKVISSIGGWFWRFALVAPVAIILGLHWRANVFYVAAMSCVIGGIYAAVMLPMLMKSHLATYLPARIMGYWEAVCRRLSWAPAAVAEQLEVTKNS